MIGRILYRKAISRLLDHILSKKRKTRDVRETHPDIRRGATARDMRASTRLASGAAPVSRARRRRAEDTRRARRRGRVAGCSLAAVLGGHAQALAFPRRARVGAGPRRGVLRVDRRQGDRGPQHRHRVRRRGDRRRQRDVPGLRRHRTHRGRYVVGISHRPIFSRIVARSHGSGGLSKTFCVFFQSSTRAARPRSSPFPARAPRAEAKRLPPRASLSVPLTNPNPNPNPNPKPKPNRTREGDALVRCPANLAFAVPRARPTRSRVRPRRDVVAAGHRAARGRRRGARTRRRRGHANVPRKRQTGAGVPRGARLAPRALARRGVALGAVPGAPAGVVRPAELLDGRAAGRAPVRRARGARQGAARGERTRARRGCGVRRRRDARVRVSDVRRDGVGSGYRAVARVSRGLPRDVHERSGVGAAPAVPAAPKRLARFRKEKEKGGPLDVRVAAPGRV